MRITVNLDTQIVSLPQPLRIKAGSQVPVSVTFLREAQPVALEAQIKLALAPRAGSPALVAYTDQFDATAGPAYLAVLDANDRRLLAAIANKPVLELVAELTWIENNKRFVTPNFAVTAEPPILTGPEASETGPTYLTEVECDNRYAARQANLADLASIAAARANLDVPSFLQVWQAGSVSSVPGLRALPSASLPLGSVRWTDDALQFRAWKLVAGNNADDGNTALRPNDYHSANNSRFWSKLPVCNSTAWEIRFDGTARFLGNAIVINQDQDGAFVAAPRLVTGGTEIWADGSAQFRSPAGDVEIANGAIRAAASIKTGDLNTTPAAEWRLGNAGWLNITTECDRFIRVEIDGVVFVIPAREARGGAAT